MEDVKGSRTKGLGFKVMDSRFGTQCSGFRAWELNLRDLGSGLKKRSVWGY